MNIADAKRYALQNVEKIQESYGNMCNECESKVFHAPKGEACAIYECAINQKHLKNCGECEEVPCSMKVPLRL